MSPEPEKDPGEHRPGNAVRNELKDELEEALPAVFPAVRVNICQRYPRIAETRHDECLIYLHRFVVTKAAEYEPYPVGLPALASVFEPAVEQIQTGYHERKTVHEVERIAGHQVVVDIYLNERSEESCEEDPVEGLGLPAYDE